MAEDSELFVGLDASKLKISVAVAVAEGERNSDVRYFGDISAEPAAVASMVAKLAKRGVVIVEGGPSRNHPYPTSLCWGATPDLHQPLPDGR